MKKTAVLLFAAASAMTLSACGIVKPSALFQKAKEEVKKETAAEEVQKEEKKAERNGTDEKSALKIVKQIFHGEEEIEVSYEIEALEASTDDMEAAGAELKALLSSTNNMTSLHCTAESYGSDKEYVEILFYDPKESSLTTAGEYSALIDMNTATVLRQNLRFSADAEKPELSEGERISLETDPEIETKAYELAYKNFKDLMWRAADVKNLNCEYSVHHVRYIEMDFSADIVDGSKIYGKYAAILAADTGTDDAFAGETNEADDGSASEEKTAPVIMRRELRFRR